MQENVHELIRRARAEEDERRAAKVAEAQLKLLTVAFDKATAYTNMLILAGYAGFFGLWQLSKDYLTHKQTLAAALLALASLTVFVLFEVSKMVIVHMRILKQTRILTAPSTSSSRETYVAALEKLASAHDSVSYWDKASWFATLVVTTVTGLAAVGVLGYSFATGLANEQPACVKAQREAR
ncbi:MAG: hypothetical protein RIS88_2782 [Pseudomonadota bacterium]|jgi:hypothetical protein